MFPYHGENPTSFGEIWQIDMSFAFWPTSGNFLGGYAPKNVKKENFPELTHCSAIFRVKISKAKLKEQMERILESTISTSWEDLYLDLLWGTKEARQVPRKKQSEFCEHHSAAKEKVKADPEQGVSQQLWQDDWMTD